MIQNPLVVFVILLVIVTFAAEWSKRHQHAKIMRILPTPLWCYVPPMVLTTLGILPPDSKVYEWVTYFALPGCLILLLSATDIKNIQKVGRIALIAMVFGILTMLIGAASAFFIFHKWIGPDSWKAIGILTASWIGGTANMIAVKQAIALPEAIFAPLFLSDITTVYLWMTFLMMLSSHQEKIDALLSADKTELYRFLASNSEKFQTNANKNKSSAFIKSGLLILIALVTGFLANWLSVWMPEISAALTKSTWAVVFVTTLGLLFSMTRFAKTESATSTKLGYYFLYWLLAASGAKANLMAIFKAPLFLVMAFTMASVHGLLLLLAGRLLKIPIAILATASQANLGGIASTPIVAATYDRKLVPIAILLAIFGNAVANYLAIFMAQFLHSLTG